MSTFPKEVNLVKKAGKRLIIEVLTVGGPLNTGARFTLTESGFEEPDHLLITVTEIFLFTRVEYQGEFRDSDPITLFNNETPESEHPLVHRVLSENLVHLDEYITQYYETEDYIVTI